MTGEGWNEIMHALARNSKWFTQTLESPCYDAELMAVTEESWGLLKAKCLVDRPNACGTDMSYVFFVAYTSAITFVVLNLVIAVILEGFDDSDDKEAVLLEKACVIWRKYDQNNSLSIDLESALLFVEDVCASFGIKSPIPKGQGNERLKLKALANCRMQITKDRQVLFVHATRWALSLLIAEDDDKLHKELEDVDNTHPKAKKLREQQEKKMQALCPSSGPPCQLLTLLATQKIEAAMAAKLERMRSNPETETRPRVAG
jgi:hypothetical protein